MKRFIVLTVLALALVLMLSGTAMAYTDYIPYLSKGTTGAVSAGNGHVDQFGTLQNEAPSGMPNTYDAYALGCFWCHGWEKRAVPNTGTTVDITRVLTSPAVQVNAAFDGNMATLTAALPASALNADGSFSVGTVTFPGSTTLNDLYDATAAMGLQALAPGEGTDTPSTTALGTGPGRWTNLAMQWGQPYGPHGGYSNTTDRCKVCHDVHAAAGSKRLTAGSTAEDICETCHDFTGGISIYGAILEATGSKPDGGHRIQNLWEADQTTDTAAPVDYPVGSVIRNAIGAGAAPGNVGSYNTSGVVIPGYMPGWANQVNQNYPQTGGVYAYTSASLASREDQLTCTDCHTPHGNTSMRPFFGDRVRLGSAIIAAAAIIQPVGITTSQDLTSIGGLGALDMTNAGVRGVVAGLLLPTGTPAEQANLFTAAGILIDPATAWGAKLATQGITRIPLSGAALAVSLVGVDALTVRATAAGINGLYLNRVQSNKLLRDYVNGLDLRNAKFGGASTAATIVGTDANGYNNYQQEGTAPIISGLGGTGTSTNVADLRFFEPYNNGQMGAAAEYGSGFCYACHRGRLGNYAGLVDAKDWAPNGSRDAARIDGAFSSFEVPQNGVVPAYAVGGIGMTDTDTCLNHPTLMSVPYRLVGELTGSYYATGAAPEFARGSYGNPGTYTGIDNAAAAKFGTATTGLALSNRGYQFWPVGEGNLAVAPDGNLGDSAQGGASGVAPARPKAPICQQCHEDSRQVSEPFYLGDTDKDVGFTTPVNVAIGLATGAPGPMTTSTFIYSGNPEFANFPHETQNYRLLVEGGDSNVAGMQGVTNPDVGGGSNDNLCLNCHVPGSLIRPDNSNGQVIFNSLVKDFNGFQE